MKRSLPAICAILLGIVFLVSGGWKFLSPFKTGELLEQAQVPAGFGPLGAATLGTLELLTAFLLFNPKLRRWGGWLGSALMIFFMAWVAYNYPALAGRECSCFPLIKRTVGPGFFIGDAVFLLLGLVAAAWSPRPKSLRIPAIAFATLLVFAGASFGIHANTRSHAQIPTPIVVDGQPQNLADGKVFLFFYDPSCMHCDAAAKFMSKLDWTGTRVVAIPTINPQWAASFLHDTHLKAATSLELEKLKKAFPFVDPPFGVALEDGHVKQTFGQAQFTPPAPESQLKTLGLIR
jgi:hypothetical protein